MAEKKELELIRIVDAPRELVWKMWTDEKHLAQWWGSTGWKMERSKR